MLEESPARFGNINQGCSDLRTKSCPDHYPDRSARWTRHGSHLYSFFLLRILLRDPPFSAKLTMWKIRKLQARFRASPARNDRAAKGPQLLLKQNKKKIRLLSKKYNVLQWQRLSRKTTVLWSMTMTPSLVRLVLRVEAGSRA
jgi:hypothetical protein